MKNYRKILSLVLVVCFLALNLTGCSKAPEEEPKKGEQKQETKTKAVAMTPLATYKPVEYQVKPAVPEYNVETGLKNISNRERFTFNEKNELILQTQGFLVYGASSHEEFHSLYEQNRYAGVPNFVTTDAMLHGYHLLFDFMLSDLEENQLTAETQKLSSGMMRIAEKQYDTLKGTDWETAAKINLGFFAVANALIDPKAAIPAAVADEVKTELAFIEKQDGIAFSPVLNMGKEKLQNDDYKEDYSQYVPRSHYTKSETLKKYFKTMMWYGRVTFLLKDENASKAAILMSLALKDEENTKTWQKIYDITAFFAGVSDDVSAMQVADEVEKAYGKNPDLKALIADKDKYKALIKDIAYLAKPKLNSIPIYQKDTAEERQKEIDGVRFMGQRYTIDADIFQNLVFPAVGKNDAGDQRMLPDRLDVAAAFGSDLATSVMEKKGAFKYDKYKENLDKMRKHVASLSRDEWYQNLYWSWMDMLKPLLDKKPEGYPWFMRSGSWQAKDLNAFLGSWTELKHDTLLYSKQVYAEMGGYPEPKFDDRGYVEPQPEIYARLAALSAFTRDGLKQRGILSAHNEDLLNTLEKLSKQLLDISIKELENKPLSDADYELIRGFGGQLEHIWYETQLDRGTKDKKTLLIENPAPLIADVATDPNGSVLEVGTGYVEPIYAVVPIDGKLTIVCGGVFSTYQFDWPMNDRLTDEKWREFLQAHLYSDEEKPEQLQQEDWQKNIQGEKQPAEGILKYSDSEI